MAKKRQTTMDEFGIAESIGEIHTMPEIDEQIFEEKKEITTIDNPEEFRMAIGAAEMNGEEYVEVSEKLFKYLLKNSKSRYLTYGNGGIKVYLKGTKPENDKIDKMSAEQFVDYDGKRRREAMENA